MSTFSEEQVWRQKAEVVEEEVQAEVGVRWSGQLGESESETDGK